LVTYRLSNYRPRIPTTPVNIMPTTKGNKLSKSDKADNKKQYKATTATKSSEAEKTVSGNDNSHCVDCGTAVLKSQAGLTCDAYHGFWHHTECEDVSDEVYEFLCDNSDDASLAWYSKKCVAVSKKLIETTVSVHDQQHQVVRVEHVCGKMEQMNQELQELCIMMNKGLDKPDTHDTIVAVEEKVTKLVETVEKQQTYNHELHDCVQHAV